MEVKFNISINLLIVIIIVAIIITSVSLTLLFNKVVINSKQEDSVKGDDCKKSNINITKKDMAYWMFFLIIIGILWGSSHIYENKTFSEYVSFSGTVTSILLGLVAIIYSFFQSADNASTKESLQGVLNELKDVSEDIKDHTDKVNKINKDMIEMSKSILDTSEKVSQMTGSINKSIYILNERLANVERKIEKTNMSIENLGKKSFQSGDWKITSDEINFKTANSKFIGLKELENKRENYK